MWVALFGIAAFTLAFVMWLAVLFERRAPASLHAFLANFTRYTVHLTAYLCLAADPYPSFTGSKPYPVDVEIDPPARQGRWGAGFRLVLAVPAFIVSSTLGGSVALGSGYGGAFAGAFGGLTATIGVLGWFASLARGRMPRGMRDAAVYAIGYGAQTTAYALMLTDRYPDSTPGERRAPAGAAGPSGPDRRRRRPRPAPPPRALPVPARRPASRLAHALGGARGARRPRSRGSSRSSSAGFPGSCTASWRRSSARSPT